MIRAFLLSFLVFSQAICAMGAEEDRDATIRLRKALQHQVQDYRVTQRDFVRALIEVAGSFAIPMGIEWTAEAGNDKPINRYWKRASVGEIIEALVGAQPGYEVKVGDEVVHVMRRHFTHDAHNFLNLRIDSFRVDHVLTSEANRQLRDLVKREVSPPPSRIQGGIAGSLASGQGESYITLEVADVPVRSLLDALAVRGGFKIWVVTFSGTRCLTPTGFYRTFSLWSRKDVPDEEQPVWDRFMWGQQPPGE